MGKKSECLTRCHSLHAYCNEQLIFDGVRILKSPKRESDLLMESIFKGKKGAVKDCLPFSERKSLVPTTIRAKSEEAFILYPKKCRFLRPYRIMKKILSVEMNCLSQLYIGGTSQPVLATQQSSPEFFDLIQSLQCGDTFVSIFPSVIYLVGIALLIHHIITMNIRPQLYRRVGRELLLQIPWQEILIFMLIYQCIKIWLSTLVLLNTLFKYYQKQLSLICPWGMKTVDNSNLNLSSFPMISKGLRDFVKIPLVVFYVITGIAPFNKYTNVSDIRSLHPLVQTVLAPRVLKIFVCTLMSIIPFLALLKLKERRPLPQFMLWSIDCRMGPIRRDRSELGASGYYLERPISELTLNSGECEATRSCSCSDVSMLKLKSKRIRSRKSVSV